MAAEETAKEGREDDQSKKDEAHGSVDIVGEANI